MAKENSMVDNCTWCEQENPINAKSCSRCLSPNWLFTDEDQSKIQYQAEENQSKEARVINRRYEVGSNAARVTEKYAKIWDSFASSFFIVSIISVVLLVIGTLVLPINSEEKILLVIFWVFVLLISYLHTTIIKGGAAFLQMMASDYIIRHDFEE